MQRIPTRFVLLVMTIAMIVAAIAIAPIHAAITVLASSNYENAQFPEFFRATISVGASTQDSSTWDELFLVPKTTDQSTVTLTLDGTFLDGSDSVFLYVHVDVDISSPSTCRSNDCAYPGLWIELPLSSAAFQVGTRSPYGSITTLTWNNVAIQDAFRPLQNLMKDRSYSSLSPTYLLIDFLLPLTQKSFRPNSATRIEVNVGFRIPHATDSTMNWVIEEQMTVSASGLRIRDSAFTTENPISLALVEASTSNSSKKTVKFEIQTKARNAINKDSGSKQLSIQIQKFTQMIQFDQSEYYYATCSLGMSDSVDDFFWSGSASFNEFRISGWSFDEWPRRVSVSCTGGHFIFHPTHVYVATVNNPRLVTVGSGGTSYYTPISNSITQSIAFAMQTQALSYSGTLSEQVNKLMQGDVKGGATLGAKVSNSFSSGSSNTLYTDLSPRMAAENGKNAVSQDAFNVGKIIGIVFGVFFGIVLLVVIIVIICCCCVGVAAAKGANGGKVKHDHQAPQQGPTTVVLTTTTQPQPQYQVDQYGQPIVYPQQQPQYQQQYQQQQQPQPQYTQQPQYPQQQPQYQQQYQQPQYQQQPGTPGPYVEQPYQPQTPQTPQPYVEAPPNQQQAPPSGKSLEEQPPAYNS